MMGTHTCVSVMWNLKERRGAQFWLAAGAHRALRDETTNGT